MQERCRSEDNKDWVDHFNHLPVGISKLFGTTKVGAVNELLFQEQRSRSKSPNEISISRVTDTSNQGQHVLRHEWGQVNLCFSKCQTTFRNTSVSS
jgi:BRCT domain type II-containing protein